MTNTPTQTTRELSGRLLQEVFNKALRDDVTPELKAELLPLGMNLDSLAPTYPKDVWAPVLKKAAELICPGDESLERLGARVVEGFEREGLFDSALFSVAKLVGPRKVLGQIAGREIPGARFLKFGVTENSKRDIEVSVNDATIAPFIGGGLRQMIEVLGGRDAEVGLATSGSGTATLHATWS